MAKIDEDSFATAMNSAPLKQVTKSTNKPTNKSQRIHLYGVPSEWVELIKHLPGYSFNSFAIQAIGEKLKKEGLI